jgi:hypothetical protein
VSASILYFLKVFDFFSSYSLHPMIQKGFSHVCFPRFFNPHSIDDVAPGFAFYPPTNFNKVALSASPAQQQRQGVSSKKAAAMEEAWGVLSKEIEGSQLLGDKSPLDVGLRSRVLGGMIDTLEAFLSYIEGCHDFLHNGGIGIGNAADESSLSRRFDECVPPQDGIKAEDRFAPLKQYIQERNKEGFRSLDLAKKFQTLADQVKAKLKELTERQKALLKED